MQIQAISQNQNNQQNFGIKAVHKGDAAEVKMALSWVVDSFLPKEQEALVAKMVQSGEEISIEHVPGGGDVMPRLFLRDSQNRPVVLHLSDADSRQNFPVLSSFLDRLPKSEPTATPQEGVSAAVQLQREFGIMA